MPAPPPWNHDRGATQRRAAGHKVGAATGFRERARSGIRHEFLAIEAQLRVLSQMPPELDAEERALADVVAQQLALMQEQAKILEAGLAKVRGERPTAEERQPAAGAARGGRLA